MPSQKQYFISNYCNKLKVLTKFLQPSSSDKEPTDKDNILDDHQQEEYDQPGRFRSLCSIVHKTTKSILLLLVPCFSYFISF